MFLFGILVSNNNIRERLFYMPEDYLDFETEEYDFLGNTENDDSNIYPHANINVERAQFSIYQLHRKYKQKTLKLDPEFQRANVWNKSQKSELIESVLMGIPLPAFYLNQTKDGTLVVIDGRQRLSTFFSFIDDEFKLDKLKQLRNNNGKYFSDLNEINQAELEDFQLVIQLIKPPTPDRIKFDIFDRVNRGGTKINNQEMRNALYQGNATKFLLNLSKTDEFLKATDFSISDKRMKDKFLILRFTALYLRDKKMLVDENGYYIDIDGDMEEFLGKTMNFLNNTSEDTLLTLDKEFKKSMTNNINVYGNSSFRRYLNRSNPINMLLFDVFSLKMASLSEQYVLKNKNNILEETIKILNNDNFNQLLITDRGKSINLDFILNIFMESIGEYND